jgi:hypothetical protein
MSIEISQELPSIADSPRQTPISSVSIAILLFLFVNCVYLLTSSGRIRTIDEIDPVMKTESILVNHTTAIPQAVNSQIYFGKFDRHGIPRSAWPDGQALLVLPWGAFGHYVLARLPGVPNGITDLVVGTAVCWSNATYGALAVATAFLLFLKLGLTQRVAVACSLLLAFSSILFVYSAWLYSEPVSAAIFMMAAYLLFGTGTSIPVSHAVFGALLLGFSMHVRPSNTVTVFVFIIAALVLDFYNGDSGFKYRTTAILLAIVAVSGMLYLFRNYMLFGNPADFGVPITGENGKDLDSWHNPLWKGMLGFLFSPGKSAFLFSIPAILGVIGLPQLWKQNRALTVVCGGVPLINLFFFALRTQWEGTYCYGPRFLVPSLVLLTIPVAALFRTQPKWLRPAFWICAIAGFIVQAIGLATNIIEDMVVNHYYDKNWDYQIGYSAITGQLRLIWKYLHVAPNGLGLGWDRWFVFLRDAGVSSTIRIPIILLFLLGAIVFGQLTWRAVRRAA